MRRTLSQGGSGANRRRGLEERRAVIWGEKTIEAAQVSVKSANRYDNQGALGQVSKASKIHLQGAPKKSVGKGLEQKIIRKIEILRGQKPETTSFAWGGGVGNRNSPSESWALRKVLREDGNPSGEDRDLKGPSRAS